MNIYRNPAFVIREHGRDGDRTRDVVSIDSYQGVECFIGRNVAKMFGIVIDAAFSGFKLQHILVSTPECNTLKTIVSSSIKDVFVVIVNLMTSTEPSKIPGVDLDSFGMPTQEPDS